MDILLPELDGPEAGPVADRLRSAGHTVHHCRRAGEPCAVLRDQPCPLDAAPVDVAVAVGDVPADRLGQGDLCAVRRRVPLVVVGDAGHPLARWAAAVVDPPAVTDAVVEVADAPLPAHSEAGQAVLAGELARLGMPGDARVEVRRRAGALRLELWPPAGVGEQLAEQIAVHVTQAVRRVDPWARGVDVAVHLAPDQLDTRPVPPME